jgi:DNA invertase Pin-like site-specific DNA recombinase
LEKTDVEIRGRYLKKWVHYEKGVPPSEGKQPLSPELIEAIKRLKMQQLSNREIARALRISTSTVSKYSKDMLPASQPQPDSQSTLDIWGKS